MPKTNKIEIDRRVRDVIEWLVDDYHYTDIVNNIKNKFGIDTRQAERYIKLARERWAEKDAENIAIKRRRKIETLKKLKRSLKPTSPAAVQAILRVEKELIMLEGISMPRKLEIKSEVKTIDTIDYEKLDSATLQAIVNARIKTMDPDDNEDTDTES